MMGMTLHILFFSMSFLTTKMVESKSELTAITRLYDRPTSDVYKIISTNEPHLTPDTTTDDETRKRICLSLTKNAYFNLFVEEDPVEDMNVVYNQLVDKIEDMKMGNHWAVQYLEKILAQDYELGENGNPVSPYRSVFIPAKGERSEFVFPCLTKIRGSRNYYLYLVSDPYNINSASDSTGEPIQARILYAALPSKLEPVVLAEEAALTFAPPEYSPEILEDIYLQVRESKNVAANEEEDPLCGLNKSGKLRACASVMNSSYFSTKVRFNPHPLYFRAECDLKRVSFRTDKAIASAGHVPYNEWMLTCSVDQKHTYRLSRAHESHYLWVYQYNKESNCWNIDSINSRIGVIIDNGGLATERGEIPNSKLGDLLKTYPSSTTDETSQS